MGNWGLFHSHKWSYTNPTYNWLVGAHLVPVFGSFFFPQGGAEQQQVGASFGGRSWSRLGRISRRLAATFAVERYPNSAWCTTWKRLAAGGLLISLGNPRRFRCCRKSSFFSNYVQPLVFFKEVICQLNPLRKFQPPRYFTRRKRIRSLIHEVLPQLYTLPSYIKRLYIYYSVIPNNYPLLPYRPIFHYHSPNFRGVFSQKPVQTWKLSRLPYPIPRKRWISERWCKS